MRTVLAAAILALPLAAQQSNTQPASQPAPPQVVVVQPGANSRPTPVKIVRVAPAPQDAPAGAFEGTRDQKNWAYYSNGGVARSRANYAIWRARFRPTNPFRSVTHVYRSFGTGWGGAVQYR